MDLKQRLARLDRMTSRGAGPAPGERCPDPAAPMGPEAPPPELGLREVATPAGPCWVREWREPAPPVPDQLPDLTGILSRHADRRPTRDRILLLDTETTGLAGGTGTLAFLIGVGWWEGGELVVRQLWLPAPGREAGMLCALWEWAAPFETVVTFNGAAFDLPLLRTRALMNRRTDPLAHLLSWDLLPAARRLWGRSLPDCRQQTVEASICGLERGDGDIEGARIPEVWRAWLGSGATDEMLCVMRHNRRDIGGMASIMDRLCAEHAAAAGPIPGPVTDWRRAWALARVAERRRDTAAAAGWIAVALAMGGRSPGDVPRASFEMDAARILKRARCWRELEALLAAVVADGVGDWAHREAAILYEHRLPHLEQALRHARIWGERVRIERLERRLAGPADAERGAGT